MSDLVGLPYRADWTRLSLTAEVSITRDRDLWRSRFAGERAAAAVGRDAVQSVVCAMVRALVRAAARAGDQDMPGNRGSHRRRRTLGGRGPTARVGTGHRGAWHRIAPVHTAGRARPALPRAGRGPPERV